MKPARTLLTVLLVTAGVLMPPCACLFGRTLGLGVFLAIVMFVIVLVPTLILFGILVLCRIRIDYIAMAFCAISLIGSLYIGFDCYHASTPAGRFKTIMGCPVPHSVQFIVRKGTAAILFVDEALEFTIDPDDFVLLASKGLSGNKCIN